MTDSIRMRRSTLASDPSILPPAPLMGPLIFFSLAAHAFLIALSVAWPLLFPPRPVPLSIMHVRSVSLPKRIGEINPGGAPSAAPATPDAVLAPVAAAVTTAPPPEADLTAIKPAGMDSGKSAPTPKAVSAPSSAATPVGKPAASVPGSEGKAGSAPGPGGYGGGTGPASGGGAGVSFDEDFAQTWYQKALERKIRSAWKKPPTAPGKNFIVRVHFVISGQNAQDVQILAGSGDRAFDQSAFGAILSAQPLPPIPAASGKDRLGVTFEFHSQE